LGTAFRAISDRLDDALSAFESAAQHFEALAQAEPNAGEHTQSLFQCLTMLEQLYANPDQAAKLTKVRAKIADLSRQTNSRRTTGDDRQ
jgi:hypothetical protein